MEDARGKTYNQIWEAFQAKHLSSTNPEHTLREIHRKWKRLAAEVKTP